jgi:hypothetical protein
MYQFIFGEKLPSLYEELEKFMKGNLTDGKLK